MSESEIYTVGLNNVGSFEVSGIPFVTGGINASGGTAFVVRFPYVTRWIALANRQSTAGVAKIAFSQEGLNGSRFFTLGNASTATSPTADSVRFEVKATEIWITGSNSFDIIAGLTNIPIARINNSSISPSGSNWSGSANI